MLAHTTDAAVGVLLPRDLPAPEVLPYARRAEEFGFDELWLVEDLGFRGGIAQAGALLAATERIIVGIGILPAAARTSAFTAMELGTLADLFPAHIHAGIGRGMPHWMRRLGIWPQSPLTLLEEQFVAIRALLLGERINRSGRYVRIDDLVLESPPRVVPPLLAGVRGPTSLELAGRVADGAVLAEPVTPEYLTQARERMGTPGRVVAYNLAAVDDDPAQARDAVRPALEWIGEPEWAPHIAPLPFAEEVARLRASSADRAAFARDLHDEWVDRLAVVGTPASARARIAGLHSAGAASAVLIPVGSDPFTALEQLARVL
ncbi:LLM class flavin-dependent oxidoreductase [Rathayibacter iranicus]|uniref:LLM class flavin-dependent oxidoreductase n=2 Tax=Rathayibacter iranicus TaxID=59737 RepID=A0AAD1AD53_9MICO|nr:LLM class flavin-dependent oxidoreductase [Rathayibacter iranicus]AZZ55968.1 LLM class flavin-dependent oxidoreductase [Rathayibacter iranicus]MWV30583.1 LLM class flavin-dependent oxidoreductase [Rathayibacter iranicus NCPPB 2253 = VKM Ac-1602]PPI47122.1 LLM class flavin-dependent oxidoreductase [Rathayibacter iranicus]PPI60122.1 LLM class flavin-dependent oxidoreductase [Rathayibacter iranicus]PPI71686.1 LLM class flavin-dependent oxidoreductase [Rathayibacter iranicus]